MQSAPCLTLEIVAHLCSPLFSSQYPGNGDTWMPSVWLMHNDNVMHLHDKILFGCYKKWNCCCQHPDVACSFMLWDPTPSCSTAMAPGHLLLFIVSNVSSLVEFVRHHVSLGLNLITEAQKRHLGMLAWQSEMYLSYREVPEMLHGEGAGHAVFWKIMLTWSDFISAL